MLIAPSSYGVLSATSANTIQGNKPELIGRTVAKKLGFKVGGASYSEVVGNIMPDTEKMFDKDLKLNEFQILQNFTLSDLSVGANYSDMDGDMAHATAPFTLGNIKHKWYESNGYPINDETKNLGCSSFRMPLTLKISVPVQVHSEYGIPRDSDLTILEQNYKIMPLSGICFAKPNSLRNTGNVTPDVITGGGWTEDFDRFNGFKANPPVSSVKFPTTGFPEASFILIMTSKSSDYIFNSNSSAVTVDVNGKVTLNSKPTGAVTITITFKNDASQVLTYTFNPTSVWVVPNSTQMNYASAVNECGNSSRIPTRAQLTNSPQSLVIPSDYVGIHNGYTRAIGSSVFSEWGTVSIQTYPGSQWTSDGFSYWTREDWMTGYKFVVHYDAGNVLYAPASSSSGYVACLE
ncbi:hypothetical protein RCS94_02050 [Orbaceae bacterium ac157xtp]